jgi:GntR family transcriptional regulator
MDSKTAKPPALQRSSPEPLYRQLAAHLEMAIRSGALAPGDRIPSEPSLAAQHGISRITVRQAIDELVRKRLIVRKHGKGTFVIAAPVRHDLRRLHGILGSLFAQAESAGTRLLRYGLEALPAEIAGEFSMRRGERALRLDRLYMIGGRAVALAEVWLTPEVAAVPRAKAELISTEDMMREAGVRLASSEVTIRAEAAGARAGRVLGISAHAPVLLLRRRALGEDGATKEIGRFWVRSEGYEFVCSAQAAGLGESPFGIRNVGADA